MIENIKLGYSSLDGKIYIYRHGKDPRSALERIEAEADVMAVLVQQMMDDAPNGSVKTFTLGDKQYELRLKPVER